MNWSVPQTVGDKLAYQKIRLFFSVTANQRDTCMVMARICKRKEETESTNTQSLPTLKENVLPSAKSDSWSGDSTALHFLCRKLANMLISVSVVLSASWILQ